MSERELNRKILPFRKRLIAKDLERAFEKQALLDTAEEKLLDAASRTRQATRHSRESLAAYQELQTFGQDPRREREQAAVELATELLEVAQDMLDITIYEKSGYSHDVLAPAKRHILKTLSRVQEALEKTPSPPTNSPE